VSDRNLERAAQQVIRDFGSDSGNVYRLMIRESCRFEEAREALQAVEVEQERWREIS